MAIKTQERPQRWDQPFGQFMTDQDVERLMTVPEIAAIEGNKFPSHIPLEGILKNDARIVKYSAGDIVIREGDYLANYPRPRRFGSPARRTPYQ